MDRLLGWIRIAGHRGWQLGGVAVGVLVLWTVLEALRLLVVIVFVTLLLAALLAPVTDWLGRWGVPRGLATALALVGTVLAVSAVVALVVMRFVGQADVIMGEIDTVRDELVTWLQQGPLDVGEAQLRSLGDRAVERLTDSWSTIASRALGVLTTLGALLTALVLAFFVIRDAAEIRDWVLTRLVSDEQRELVATSIDRAVETLQGYIRASVIIGGLDGLLIGIALAVLDVPLAAPLGVLTFLGGFFPVVGATLAGALAALVATVTNGVVTGLVVVLVVIAIQQLDGNLLQPVVMGRAVDLHPVVVLLALTGGGLLAGIVGALLAVPTTAVLAAVGNEVRLRRDEEAPRASDADRQVGPHPGEGA